MLNNEKNNHRFLSKNLSYLRLYMSVFHYLKPIKFDATQFKSDSLRKDNGLKK
jgi:hypothetical protein